jgi:hypothetical protein
MKNSLSLLAASLIGMANKKIFGGKLSSGWSLRKDPWMRGKRTVGHREGIARGAAYNKAMYRCYDRSLNPDWGKNRY